MTREEAIKIFNEVLLFGKASCTQAEFEELALMSIKALKQDLIIDKIITEINNLTVYYTTKDKGINLISQNAVNRIFDKWRK